MALLRALARIRSTWALHLRISSYTSQDSRKAFAHSFTSSTDESLEQQKSDNPSSESSKAADSTEEVTELATSDDGQFGTYIKVDKSLTKGYSHFVSLPLAFHSDLVERMRRFRDSVLAEENEGYVSWFPATAEADSGSNVPVVKSTSKAAPKIKARYVLDPDLEGFFSDDDYDETSEEQPGKQSGRIESILFVKPQTVHTRLFNLDLFTDKLVNLAAEVLQDVKPKVLETLDGHEPKVHLRGIELRRGTPSEAQLLSMRVEEIGDGGHLMRACQVIKDAYIKARLLSPALQGQAIKLRVTLMGTSSQASRSRNRMPFDARKIIAKYHREDWGEYVIKQLHLSQRRFYDPDGYFRCCSSFELLPSPPLSSSESSASYG